MAITPLGADLDIIARLSDEPNDVEGLSAEELKAKFDEAGNTIKGYINETLIGEVDTGFASLGRELLDEVDRKIVKVGNLPSGGTSGQVLLKASNADSDTEWAEISQIPAGGTKGQVLTKKSGEDGDTGFETQRAENVYLSAETAGALGLNPAEGRNVDEGISAALPEIGDTLTTARTDLNDDWLLCNGDVFDTAQYPELADLLPIDVFRLKTVTFPEIPTSIFYSEANCVWICISSSGNRIHYTSSMDNVDNWVAVPYTFSDTIYTVAYGNGYWVASCRNSPNIYYATSLTASSWSKQNIGASSTRMKFINNTWVASYDGRGSILYKAGTPDGTWSTLDTQLGNVYDFDYGNGRFVFGGRYSGAPYISHTTSLSTTPTRQSVGANNIVFCVIYIESTNTWYCAAGQSPQRFYYRADSPDGAWSDTTLTNVVSYTTGFKIIRDKDGLEYLLEVPDSSTSNLRYRPTPVLRTNTPPETFAAPIPIQGELGADGRVASSGEILAVTASGKIAASLNQLPTVAIGVNTYIKGR